MRRKKRTRLRSVLANSALLLVSLGVGLALVEVALWIANQPRFPTEPRRDNRFHYTGKHEGSVPIWVNVPSTRQRFEYDSNPRSYFGPDNEVEHPTNSWGFRGPEFGPRGDEDERRIVFLGDSFTFGEGVWFEDTFAELTAAALNANRNPGDREVRSFNLGVGGYNVSQSYIAFKMALERLSPDLVVLCFTINDVEPPLFRVEPRRGRMVRRDREIDLARAIGRSRPPERGLLRLRSVRLVWKLVAGAIQTRRTVAYYRNLYTQSNPSFAENMEALRDLVRHAREAGVPCVVMIFPLLHDLDDDHPFLEIYALVRSEVERAGGSVLDLFPRFRGMDAEKLWVHPTDPHPNEVAHRVAATALVEYVRDNRLLP